jgi:hypothetical protein
MNEVTLSIAEKIERLESILLSVEQVDLRTAHEINGGMYARTIYIPAGTALTSATHKKDHINVFFGDVSFLTEDGMKRMTGHHVLPTRAGMKRVGMAHADTVWTTIVATNLTDVSEIEDECVIESDRLQTRVMALETATTEQLEK